jgi:hypothetical protein
VIIGHDTNKGGVHYVENVGSGQVHHVSDVQCDTIQDIWLWYCQLGNV